MSLSKFLAVRKPFRVLAVAMTVTTSMVIGACTLNSTELDRPVYNATAERVVNSEVGPTTISNNSVVAFVTAEIEPASSVGTADLILAAPNFADEDSNEPNGALDLTPEGAEIAGEESPGIRPDQAQLLRLPEEDLQPTVEWRPPPVTVPHALNPDDHYWLARPIPSDRRNYDLEWYPYGNRPMRREALPYRVHHGMDFPNESGTPIFAASSGTVTWAGPLASNRNGVNYYGNTVVILHDWQWLEQSVYTLYAHTLELFVQVGDHVEQGELIAGVGASGEVSGPHLHLEVRVGTNNYLKTRNPALWLAPYEGWGNLAGRFMDSRGRLIHGAMVRVVPERVESNARVPIRTQRTYSS